MRPAPEQNDDQSTIVAADRALAILEWLSECDGGAQSIRTIADATGLRRSTVHRLLETMARRSWVVKAPEGSYKLGTRALHVGAAVLSQIDVLATIRPLAMQLRGTTAQTVFICVQDASQLLIIDKFESPSQLRFTRPVGSRSLLHASASGKALLAAMAPAQLDAYLAAPLAAATPATITNPERLRADIENVRRRGYAMTDGEGYIGITSFGAAVRDHTGNAVAALSVSGPSAQMEAHRDAIVSALCETAQTAGQLLGYIPGRSALLGADSELTKT